MVIGGLAGCIQPGPAQPPSSEPPKPGFNPFVKFSTDAGDFYVEVMVEQAPLTAQNFLGYARSHFYDGTRVHRVVPGQLVQMGDPSTRDVTKRAQWGYGDPNLRPILDEFNPALRHDAPGVVSMANAGPDTGSSQFFITLAPNTMLDDKHAVFGRIAWGLETVQGIGRVATTSYGQVTGVPAQDIVVRSTEVLDAQRDPAQVRHALSAWSYRDAWNTTQGYIVQASAVLQNGGNVLEAFDTGLNLPEGWGGAVACPHRDAPKSVCPLDRNLSAGASRMVLFQVGAPRNASGGATVGVWFNASGVNITLPVTFRVGDFGEQAGKNDTVLASYIGTLTDGRLFDSSLWSVVSNASIPKVSGSILRPEASYRPFEFTVGEPGLIEGFSDIAASLRVGETASVAIPPQRAYGYATPGAPHHDLANRWLVFTMELQRITA
jgi:cyclophilin family peptidyl-prolyl cis-trans isomerase